MYVVYFLKNTDLSNHILFLRAYILKMILFRFHAYIYWMPNFILFNSIKHDYKLTCYILQIKEATQYTVFQLRPQPRVFLHIYIYFKYIIYFQHAKNKSLVPAQLKQSDSSASNSVKLLSFYQLNGLGCPHYTYFDLPDRTVQAQLVNPINQQVICGQPCANKVEACESAAEEVLMILEVICISVLVCCILQWLTQLYREIEDIIKIIAI